jgi:CubicO group peptidase (beta-lactamase class C family)
MQKSTLLCLAFILLISVPSPAQSITEERLQQLDQYLQAAQKANHIPAMAVGIVDRNGIQHLKAWGEQQPGGGAIQTQSPFLLCSLTKSFTGLAITQLEEAGKLSSSDPVVDHLPWFRLKNTPYSDQITIAHLLAHESGIPRISSYKTNQPEMTLENKVRRLQEIEGTKQFGQFAYANDNYVTLGLIVEKASGQSFEEYLQSHILNPLQMEHTYFAQSKAKRDQMAHGTHLYFGKAFSTGLEYNRANLPNGGILSSAEDMCHYLMAHLNEGQYQGDSIASKEYMRSLLDLGPEGGYHRGWFAGMTQGEYSLVHSGRRADFSTRMGIFPETGLGWVVLMNQSSAFLNGQITQIPDKAVAILRGDEVAMPRQNLNRAYLIFMALSILVLLWEIRGIFRALQSRNFATLTAPQREKKRLRTWLGNLIIPLVFIPWFWYLAHYQLASLHYSQPDILLVVLSVLALSLLTGLLTLRQLRRVKPY